MSCIQFCCRKAPGLSYVQHLSYIYNSTVWSLDLCYFQHRFQAEYVFTALISVVLSPFHDMNAKLKSCHMFFAHDLPEPVKVT